MRHKALTLGCGISASRNTTSSLDATVRFAKLIDSDVDEMDNMIQLNVTALTRLTSAALPGFLKRSKGLIINISSIAALSPDLLNGVYGGTKAFVVSLTQSLHNEVKDKGI